MNETITVNKHLFEKLNEGIEGLIEKIDSICSALDRVEFLKKEALLHCINIHSIQNLIKTFSKNNEKEKE